MSVKMINKSVQNLSNIEKEILAIMLDLGAIGENKITLNDIIKEVQRRENTQKSGMLQ